MALHQSLDQKRMDAPPPANTGYSSGARGLTGLPLWAHAWAWGGILAVVLLLLGASHSYDGRNVWRDWTEAKELRRPAYAERICPDDLLRTRANSWSNLTYVLVGCYAIALGCHDLRRKPSAGDGYLIHTPPMSILFGATCCYLGFGSGFFHASLTRWGQQLDVAAMYAPLLACIAINLGRWIPVVKTPGRPEGSPTWPILIGMVLVTSFLLYQYKWSMRSEVVLPTLILTVGVFALLDRLRPRHKLALRWLGWSTVALVAARVCWQLDVAGKFSGPDVWLQGHAVWHLLTGLSLACIYLYYRSEVNLNPTEAPLLPEKNLQRTIPTPERRLRRRLIL
jgi:hypothetical protein